MEDDYSYGDYDYSYDDDFWNMIGIDPDTIEDWDTPTNDEIWEQISGEDPSTISAISKFASGAGTKALGALTKMFTDKNGNVNWGNLAALAGGLYGAYQSRQEPPKTGYQGKIPEYTAVRANVPGSQTDTNRRPGSGGLRYFSDTSYAKPSDVGTATTAAQEQAAGLAALNKANPYNKPSPTLAAAKRGEESQKAVEGTAASKVIEKEPVPTYAHGGITALAKGRYLGGATDGMADKIPASIDGKQEARLSHGEFVIPADVVGHLGNGNSEAGAQRLYEMMDKIRKARTGTTKQGKQINPNKFLPS